MENREAITIRFPTGLLTSAREVKAARESLNDLVVEAVHREIRRRQGLDAHTSIVQLREQIRARTGPHPDAGPLIRALREGDERRA
ncbi:MAG: hypothetical protein HYY04_04950 [Chloroflexi bacterium]|nr:hypothetical protein [Chloroflexota bacterium]